MRKSVIRFGFDGFVNRQCQFVCRATGPLPPMFPSYGCEIICRYYECTGLSLSLIFHEQY